MMVREGRRTIENFVLKGGEESVLESRTSMILLVELLEFVEEAAD
jgi:hypothetical protein